tara:strand:+ start:558 stop:764 length:207 start_codon:yes stop_codon:yes gene_type:complete
MEDLIDLIATDGSASDVSDKIKDILYAKSAERIDQLKAPVANLMFNDVEEVETEEPDQEPTAELETEE